MSHTANTPLHINVTVFSVSKTDYNHEFKVRNIKSECNSNSAAIDNNSVTTVSDHHGGQKFDGKNGNIHSSLDVSAQQLHIGKNDKIARFSLGHYENAINSDLCPKTSVHSSLNDHLNMNQSREVNASTACGAESTKDSFKQGEKCSGRSDGNLEQAVLPEIPKTKKLYHCSYCEASFSYSSHRRRHELIHKGEWPFKCEECGVPFRVKESLIAHASTHLPKPAFSCKECGEKFSRLSSLTLHTKVHNVSSENKYIGFKHAGVNAEEQQPIVSQPLRAQHIAAANVVTHPGDSSSEQMEMALLPKEQLNEQIQSTSDGVNSCVKEVPYKVPVPLRERNEFLPPAVKSALKDGTIFQFSSKTSKPFSLIIPKCLMGRSFVLTPSSSKSGDVGTDPSDTQSRIEVTEVDNLCIEGETALHSSIIIEGYEEEHLKKEPDSVHKIHLNNIEVVESQVIEATVDGLNTDLSSGYSYSCTQCPEKFIDVESFQSHMEMHPLAVSTEVSTIYQCPFCKGKFTKDIALSRHIKNVHHYETDAPKKQKITQKSPSKPEAEQNNSKNRGNKQPAPVTCKVCGKMITTMTNYTIHMRTHTNERPYACDICKQTFRQISTMKAHVMRHTGEKPYKCMLCSSRFIQSGALKRHIRSTHEKNSVNKKVLPSKQSKNVRKTKYWQPVTCLCGKTFKTKTNYLIHMRTHTNERPYECSFCELKFKQISTMKAHMMRHTGEKPYNCHFCKASFIQSGARRRHIKSVHENGKIKSEILECQFSKSSIKVKKTPQPKICSVCEKTCKTSTNLILHMRTHTNERPYTCDICSHKFKQISTLKAHVMRHTGEKPYKCNVCLSSFIQSGALRRHIRSSHESNRIKSEVRESQEKKYRVKNFYCKICNKTFLGTCLKVVHMRSHKKAAALVCKICGKSYRTKETFNRHSKIHELSKYIEQTIKLNNKTDAVNSMKTEASALCYESSSDSGQLVITVSHGTEKVEKSDNIDSDISD